MLTDSSSEGRTAAESATGARAHGRPAAGCAAASGGGVWRRLAARRACAAFGCAAGCARSASAKPRTSTCCSARRRRRSSRTTRSSARSRTRVFQPRCRSAEPEHAVLVPASPALKGRFAGLTAPEGAPQLTRNAWQPRGGSLTTCRRRLAPRHTGAREAAPKGAPPCRLRAAGARPFGQYARTPVNTTATPEPTAPAHAPRLHTANLKDLDENQARLQISSKFSQALRACRF